MDIRCVVTGQNDSGKSIVVRSTPVPPISLSLLPGYEFHRLWGSDSVPELPSNGTPPSFPRYFPPGHGFRFGFFTIPPDTKTDLARLATPAAFEEIQRKLPGMIEVLVSLQGLFQALAGNSQQALRCVNRACANPKTFGHAHHTYYQVACILSLLGQLEVAFGWLERSVDTGFACWPFFLRDPFLQNLRTLPGFESLLGSLQAKYPDHLGILEVNVS